MLRELASSVYGYHGLQLSAWRADESIIEASATLSRASLYLRSDDVLDGDVRCAAVSLPVDAGSVRLVVLDHVLERCAEPRAVFSECERILETDGVLLISAFNGHGIWRMLGRRVGVKSWHHRHQLRRWLQQENLEVMIERTSYFRRFGSRQHESAWWDVMMRRVFPFWGAGLVMLARKRRLPVTMDPAQSRQWARQAGRAAPAARVGCNS